MIVCKYGAGCRVPLSHAYAVLLGTLGNAAVSAVTSGDKIYNSVNKLFQLSSHCPIGIMIYGSAEIMGYPWEAIIKIYREQLGPKSFATVADHAEDFVQYIAAQDRLFPDSQRLACAQRSILANLKEVFDYRSKLGVPKGADADLLIRKDVEQLHLAALLKDCPELANLPLLYREKLEAKYGTEIERLARQQFSRVNLRPETIALITKFCVEDMCRDSFLEYSGVVIAGFGERDLFPGFVEYKIAGMISDGFFKFKKSSGMAIHFDNGGGIAAFAQDEMVSTFMRGIHPSVHQTLDAYLKAAMSKYEAAVLSHMRRSQKLSFAPKLEQATKSFLKEWSDELAEHQNMYHIEPVMASVEMLPNDELAAMAESLVNLTVLKRRISKTARETVGGPIDVAVISKGDGFIWIKRKHYFSKELNPRYFALHSPHRHSPAS